MKLPLFLKLISLLLIGTMFSCQSTTTYRDDYEVVQNPAGQKVVYVENGGHSYFLEYAMFMSLMNNGGMNNVNRYYNTNKTVIINNQKNYSSYTRPRSDRFLSTNKYSSPSTNSNKYTNKYSSPKSGSYYSNTNRYSSPSKRSSYSSPSRSSSSTKKSYSSPSKRR